VDVFGVGALGGAVGLLTGDILVEPLGPAAEDAPDNDRATELEAAGGRVIELGAADWRALAA
jgi:hypothetical protein